MIYIEYPGKDRPTPEWLAKAEALTRELKEAPDKATRDKIIDKSSAVWGEIKNLLALYSHQKCWFSEARDTFSYMQVEHFRPKKLAKDPDRDGYWWLAFDYLNYRLCGGVGNLKKGSFFPLRPNTSAALSPNDNCDDEAPVLIDPTCKDDVDLITFTTGGIPVPAESEGWRRERARISIERYNLTGWGPLRNARAAIWYECEEKITELAGLIDAERCQSSPSRKERIKTLKDRLREMTKPTSEYSAVARAFLLQNTQQWVRHCVF